MPCTDKHSRARAPWPARATAAALALGMAWLLVGCSSRALAPAPAAIVPPPAAAGSPGAAGTVPAPASRPVALPAPPAPRNRLELEVQFAQRLVQAHPDGTYLTRAPDRLMAIPVLEIELNADGSVRRIEVLRHPSTGDEATRLAIAAVRRAAPYGDVSRLPRPWKVVETFLFNDEMRFKPRILDLQ